MTSVRTAAVAPSATGEPGPGLDVPGVFSPPWCWARLAAAHEGMLTFVLPRGPIALPVPCALRRGQLVVALAPSDMTGWSAAGGHADLVVTGIDDGRRWLVRASGRADRARADDPDAQLLASPRDRPRLRSDPAPDHLLLTSLTVQGAYVGR